MSAKDTTDFASHVIENKTYIEILFKWRIDALGTQFHLYVCVMIYLAAVEI